MGFFRIFFNLLKYSWKLFLYSEQTIFEHIVISLVILYTFHYIMIWYIYFYIFKQTLTLQTWNTYKWKDSRLAWTPTDWNNITTLKFSRHDTIWVPDVFVFKIVDEVIQFGDFQYIVSSDGSVLYIPIEIHRVKKNII